MPQLGPQYDQAKRLAALEDLVSRLAANQIGQAFSSNQSDGSVGMQVGQNPNGSGATAMIFYQGPTTARDGQSGLHQALLYIGELYAGGVSVNSGALFSRPDATHSTSMVIGDKGVQILDAKGNYVVQSDEHGTAPTGQGLGSPWVGYGPPISNIGTNWPSTTATALSGVSILSFPAQHPQIAWSGSAYCPAGTTGQVQVQINNGAAGPVHNCGAGYTSFTEAIPLGTWSFQQGLTLSGLAAVTSGPGPIYFGITGVWGQGSS